MRYTHRFTVKAPLATVSEFHRRAASMAAITPPPIVTLFHRAPESLADGDVVDFTLWLGPLPVRWLAQIENVSPEGFTDRQLSGPFRLWQHGHKFVRRDERTTEVIDTVEWALRRHPVWFGVGLGMGLSLPLLFAYRGWKTRRLLEHSSP
jgi:ligand-binding SRPBCC domain-containing protein